MIIHPSMGVIFPTPRSTRGLPITLLAWLTVRSGLASLPAGVSWAQVAAVSALGGIGFTMSLFIGSLAFNDERLIDVAKLGIIFGSLAAALVGAAACALAPGPRVGSSH
jgi:NhaA family Na+:H+ antiporter